MENPGRQVDSQYGVGSSEWDKVGPKGSDAGDNIKSVSGWSSGGAGYDMYDFTALPAGYRGSNGSFNDIGDYTCFWSSTEYNSDNAWRRYLFYLYSVVFRNEVNKESGRSVRCLKDN